VVAQIEEKLTPIAMGYSDFDKMRVRVENILG
jgi:hypothetical protein